MEEKRTWAGTFGVGRGLANYYVKIENCTYLEACKKMSEMFGPVWCDVYPVEDWVAKDNGTKCLNDYIEVNIR